MNGTRSTGTWVVGLEAQCTEPSCSAVDSATVRDTSCEDARQGVMKVLRYRGWQLGKAGPSLCPKHAPPPVTCPRCGEPTPSMYMHEIGAYIRERLPELGSLQHKSGLHLCVGCFHWARDIALSLIRTERI